MGSQQGSSVSYSYLKYKGLAHLNLATCAAHNFDHPNELDLALLVEHLRVLKRGKAVEVPTYNFAMRARMPGAATKKLLSLRLHDNGVTLLLFGKLRMMDDEARAVRDLEQCFQSHTTANRLQPPRDTHIVASLELS